MRLSRFVAATTAAAIALALLAVFAWNGQRASAVLDPDEAAFLTIINQYRADNGKGPLVEDAGLQVGSEWLANDRRRTTTCRTRTA